MSMRITTLMTSTATLRDLTQDVSQLSKLQQKLSSGKEITKPSDDPYGTSRALQLGGEIEGLQQFQRNVDDGTAWLNTADTALSKVSDVAQRARELLLQGSTDSASPQARAAAQAKLNRWHHSARSRELEVNNGRQVRSPVRTAGGVGYTQTAADREAVGRFSKWVQ